MNLIVCNRPPRYASVGCLPQPAAGGAHVVLVGPRRAAANGNRSAAAWRPDAAPPERAERSDFGRRRGAAALRAKSRRLDKNRAEKNRQNDALHRAILLRARDDDELRGRDAATPQGSTRRSPHAVAFVHDAQRRAAGDEFFRRTKGHQAIERLR